MIIVRSEKYTLALQDIITYISKDSKAKAFDFKNELDKAINDLVHMPYKFRQSIYFTNKNIRDLVFKGYVLPYKIDTFNNQIIIIGVNKYKANL